VEVAEAATPADMNKPMYMLVDLAVGGQAGAPPDHLATPAEMKIDYVRAYTLDQLQQNHMNIAGTSDPQHHGFDLASHA
jgi:beta-glucanase (GH16 family)